MAKDEGEKKEPEIKVTDKRRFTTEGESHEGGKTEPEADVKDKARAENQRTKEEKRFVPEIDFATFVLSLATSAQVHLGIIANPATGKKESDLTLAKQTVDILGILQEKTKGNLSDEENRLVEHVLYDLRMIYVEKNKS